MSDPRTNTTIVRETRSGNGGTLFVLGAIVVALGVVLYFVLGGGTMQTGASAPSTSTSVTVEAPAATAPAAEPAAPAPAAPAAEPAAPAAEPAAPAAPADTAPKP
jgi:predicted lipid-binding transport protein (Tim44 family)